MRLPMTTENKQRARRNRLRSPNASGDVRSKPTLRFFGRSQSTNALLPGMQSSKSFTNGKDSNQQTQQPQSSRRRSFLVRPPAPSTARKVLGVLQTTPKRSYSATTQQVTANIPPVISTSVPISDQESSEDEEQNQNQRRVHYNLVDNEVSSHSSEPQDEQPQTETSLIPIVAPISSDANSSRDAPLGPPPGAAGPELMEVEASEISDEAISNVDPKSRSSRTSGSSALQSTQASNKRPPKSSHQTIPSVSAPSLEIAFNTVGEEDDNIPAAPTSYSRKNLWSGVVEFDERVRELQEEADSLRKDKTSLERENDELHRRNRELEILIGSVRMRASDSNTEVQELSRQMKDSKKRMNRKLRDLERELDQQKSRHSEEMAKLKATEKHLRAELDNFVDVSTKKRNKESGPVEVRPSVRDRARAIESAVALQAQNTHFNRMKTSGSLSAIQRKKSMVHEVSTNSVRSYPGMNRNNSTVSDLSEAESSARTLARRSLIRRAFIAHVHSTRYGSSRNAWNEFLGGEAGTVSSGQFGRAIRSLAIASDARDRDLERLQCEICDVDSCDGINITFPMFVRFYQRTKNEST